MFRRLNAWAGLHLPYDSLAAMPDAVNAGRIGYADTQSRISSRFLGEISTMRSVSARLVPPNLLLALAAPSAFAENVLVNDDFATADLTGWSTWVVRNNGGNFSANASSTELALTGTDFQAGVYQQFDTGGPGNVVNVSGTWRSNPTVPDAMWAEVWIINANRVPSNGAGETDGVSNAVLLYRNDTFAGRGAWNGVMPKTSPVKYQVSFVAAGNKATLILSTGNTGASTFSGAAFDNISVSRVAPAAALAALPGGFAARTCTFPITGMAVMGQHPINRKIYAIQNGGSSNIYKIDTTAQTLSPVLITSVGSSGLEFTGGCQGMTFDTSGNLYVSSHNGDILKGTYLPAIESFAFSVLIDLDETRVGGDHGVGGLAIGPDGKLYINSGSLLHGTASQGPEPDNGLSARILRVNLNGTGLETFCKGIRNHFDITFRLDGKLFGTENGPDCHYADELNLLELGNHYGYPYKYGSDTSGSDSTLDSQCVFTPPDGLTFTPSWANYGPDARPGPGQPGYTDGGVYYGLTPHSSPDGLSFYEPSRMRNDAVLFPSEYQGRAFVARFGQQLPVPGNAGFDVISLRLDDANQGFFANTLLTGMGRCIDVLAADNGCVYVLEFNQQTTYGGSGGSSVSRLTELRYTLAAGPRINVDPVSISRTIDIAENLPDEVLEVWNAGNGTLNFTAVVDGVPTWLHVTPTSGQSTGTSDVRNLTIAWDLSVQPVGVWDGNIRITEAQASNSPQLVPVHVNIKTVLPDFDLDGDVDETDFGHFQECLSAILNSPIAPACTNADFTRDSTVDASDFNVFVSCLAGANVKANKTCDDAWEQP